MKISRILVIFTVVVFCVINTSYGVSIYGKATSSGNPVAGALITAVKTGLPNPAVYNITSAEDGNYRFDNVENGMYVVTCAHTNYQVQTEQINVNNFDVELNFDLKKGNSILKNLVHGKVIDCVTMKSINSANVYLTKVLTPDDTEPVQYQSSSFFNGQILFNDVMVGEYEVTVEKEGYQLFKKLQNIILSEEFPIFIDLNLYLAPEGTENLAVVTGQVTLDQTVLPDSLKNDHARIQLFSKTDSFNARFHFNTSTNFNGSYSIENISPHDYSALCQPLSIYPVMEKEITLAADDTLTVDFNYLDQPTEDYGKITGKVTFNDGTPVQNAYIEFILFRNYYHHTMPRFDSITTTDENGEYAIDLPEGDYYACCTYFNENYRFIYHVFYDSVHTMAEATLLTVTKEQTIENINFTIPKDDADANVVIAGTVTDNEGNPLENAKVSVWGAFQINRVSGENYAMTDAQGNYRIEFSANLAHQFGLNFVIVSAVKENYYIEFYNEKSRLFEADRIYIEGDVNKEDVNFTLDPKGANSQYSISGTVYSEDGSTIANAYLIGTKKRSGEIFSGVSDALGQYKLANLEQGEYFLMAVAEGYIPEFYNDAMIWERATPISVNGEITGIDITLSPMGPGANVGSLAGRIFDQNELPISGALVSVKNAHNHTIGYSLTDENGSYQVQGMENGNYVVSASKVQYDSGTEDVTYEQENGSTQLVDFVLNSTSFTNITPEASDVTLPDHIALINNYPNPFNPSTTISFSLPEAQKVRIVIYNILGSEIRELVNGHKSAGYYSVTWDGRNNSGIAVTSGIYIVALETESTQVVRKMLLNK